MHTFLPDFRMLRSLAACVLLLFAVLAVPAQTNKKIKQLQSQRNELKKQIAESEKMLRSTKKDVRSQLGNLVVLNTQIGEQQKFVEGIQSEISLLDGDISVLEKRLDSLGRDLSSCKAKYQRAVMYMFRNRLTQSRWMFVLQAKDFRQMYRRMRYVTEYTKYPRVRGEVIRRKAEYVKARQAERPAARKEKDKLLSEGRSEQQKLEERKRERETLVERLKGKESQLQASINQTRKKYSNLNARIDQLIQQEIAAAERRRKQAEARRKAEAERKRREQAAREKASRSGARSQASRGKSSSRSSSRPERTAVPDFQAADNADRVLSGSFAANKGRLPVPVTGPYSISSRYGQYKVEGLRDVHLDNKGINITGRSGAKARCVFQGEVTAVFAYGGMYNVIVRHGSYITVYCNLSSASVRQGQKVSARQTLGSSAPDAAGTCTLHVQLRKDTSKLNPEAWIAR